MSITPLHTSGRLDDAIENESTPPAIAITGLSKVYEGRPALSNISFGLQPGAILALMGPNGAGKTTLLRILATLAKPTTGTIQIGTWDGVRDADMVRSLIGYVGHQPHVYDDLTPRENLVFFARMYGLRDGNQRATKLLERIGLRTKADERTSHLSRGQLQRLAIARGILHDPDLLLLDEPDTGLDEPALELLKEIVHTRAETAAVTIFTTHHLERGFAWAHQVMVLVRGQIALRGQTDQVTVTQARETFQQGRR